MLRKCKRRNSKKEEKITHIIQMVFKEDPLIVARLLAKKAFCRIAFRAYCPPGSQIVLIKECNGIVIFGDMPRNSSKP